MPGDLQEEAICHRLIDCAVQELGGIDILVNLASQESSCITGEVLGVTGGRPLP